MIKFIKNIFSDFCCQSKEDFSALKGEICQKPSLWQRLKDAIKENPHYYFFLCITTLGLLQLYICIYVTNGACLKDFLFFNPTDPFSDSFMDFFNPVRSLYMENPYTQVNAMYPPINYLIMALFTGSIPVEDIVHDMTSFSGIDYLTLLAARNSREAMWSYLGYVFATTLIFIYVVNKILKKNNIRFNLFFDLCMLFSWGFMYTFDRGNFLIIVIDFLLIFFLSEFYESKVIQELGLIAFAFGICMKIYPVLLSVHLLCKKQYSKFVRLAIYCIILFFVPFAFYGGLDAMLAIITNVFSESARLTDLYPGGNINFVNIIYVFELITGYTDNTIEAIKGLAPLVIIILSVCSCFVLNRIWKRIAVITVAFLLFPGASTLYNLVYMVIPLILFLCEKGKKGFDYIYIILFSFCLVPYPYVIFEIINLNLFDGNNITCGTVLASISLITMFLLLSGEAVYNILNLLLKRIYKTEKTLNGLYYENGQNAIKAAVNAKYVIIISAAYLLASVGVAFWHVNTHSAINSIAAVIASLAELSPIFAIAWIAGVFMQAGSISLKTLSANAFKLCVPAIWSAGISVTGIVVNLFCGADFAIFAVIRCLFGIILSMAAGVIFCMLISVFRKNNRFGKTPAVIVSVVALCLGLLSVFYSGEQINMYNPIHLICRYMLSGAALHANAGFYAFIYQPRTYFFFGILGLLTVLCYYIKDYETRNKLRPFFNPFVALKMVAYRDRHNL